AIASDVGRQLSEMAEAREVQIRVGQLLPKLYLDPARLELILLNLVSNAIKYSDNAKAGRYVAIEASPSSDPESVTILVSDNGIGIATEDQPAIFERFFRAHTQLDGPLAVSGSGLGLAIVNDCVQSLGGTVRCESTVGEGTTFIVTLPANRRPPP